MTLNQSKTQKNDFQKIGGIAALIHSAAYLVAIGLYLTVLAPMLDAEADRYLALLKDHQSLMYVWIFTAYWVSAFCLVIVSLALFDRLKACSSEWLQIATVCGLIWAGLIIASGNLMLHDFGELVSLFDKDPAQAETVWQALKAVENGIVSGNELIGGIWILLLSWTALRYGGLPKSLNFFGIVIGAAGIVSIVPPAAPVAISLFGLSMIAWFAGLGIVMLRGGQGK